MRFHQIRLIYANDQNGLIGLRNKQTGEYAMPWSGQKEDIKFFKNHINNQYIVVSNRTFETLPPSIVELPNRIIIFSKNPKLSNTKNNNHRDYYMLDGNIFDFLDEYDDSSGKNFMICGGALVYNIFLPYAGYVYETRFDFEVDYDTDQYEGIYFNLPTQHIEQTEEFRINSMNGTFRIHQMRNDV